MADIERVGVMVMRSRLHWLGHLEQIDNTHLPKCLLVYCPLGGKCSVGGPDDEMVWCDYEGYEQMWFDSRPVWCSLQERAAWRAFVDDGASKLNCFLEENEEKEQDELKLGREGNGHLLQSQSSTLCSTEPGCEFVGQSKAGLVNHTQDMMLSTPLHSLLWPDPIARIMQPHQLLPEIIHFTTLGTTRYLSHIGCKWPASHPWYIQKKKKMIVCVCQDWISISAQRPFGLVG